jgi:hypothetical protein
MVKPPLPLLGAATILVACAPKIHQFSVTPAVTCLGDTVSVTFDVSGTPHLLTVDFENRGQPATRYIVVTERRGKRQQRIQDVEHYAGPPVDTLAFDTELLGTDSLRAGGSFPDTDWPAHLRIREVSTDAGRAVVVTHAGRSGQVGPTVATSGLWRGLPVSGDWELRTAIAPGEEVGNPDQPPTEALALNLTLSCGRTP